MRESLLIPFSMAKRITDLNHGLRQAPVAINPFGSPASGLLSLGLDALGLLTRETVFVMMAFSRPDSVLPVFIKVEEIKVLKHSPCRDHRKPVVSKVGCVVRFRFFKLHLREGRPLQKTEPVLFLVSPFF